jgi:hypothetical protein
MLFYLSFADGRLPKGNQWLGAIITEAENDLLAVAKTHKLKINPGGEVLTINLQEIEIDPKYYDRLLTKADLEYMDTEHGGPGKAVNILSGEPV